MLAEENVEEKKSNSLLYVLRMSNLRLFIRTEIKALEITFRIHLKIFQLRHLFGFKESFFEFTREEGFALI